jgi:hypothetical protein
MDISALPPETSSSDLSALVLATVGLVLLAILLPLLVILARLTRPLKRQEGAPANDESMEDAWAESGRRMKPGPATDEDSLPTDGEFG